VKRLFPLLVAALAASACKKDAIEVRRVPKEAAPAVGLSEAPRPASGLKWSLPAGWKELPGNAMRAATFELPKGPGKAEVTVVTLPGDVGGELANVNRWRGQLALPPVSEADLAAARTRLRCPAGEALVYDLLGTGEKKTRMVAAMLQVSGTTWFFKLMGDEQAVAAAKPAFLTLLRGLKSHA
jgi:hypothetical protein